jgi:hypothetical protein
MYGDDELFFRPGFWKFIKYVKSQNGYSMKRSESDKESESHKESEDLRSERDTESSRRDDDSSRRDDVRRKGSDVILLGIWTFGTRGYLNVLRPYLGDSFAFFHTIEEMKRGMLDKQLDYVIEKNNLPFNRSLPLPPNMFLVDNRPENIYHEINRNNGIMVESFVGHNPKDTMFQNLQHICNSLLKAGRMPNQYIKRFNIKGYEMPIACIGSRFDGPDGEPGGLVPIRQRSKSLRKSRSRGGSKTKFRERKQNYTKKTK